MNKINLIAEIGWNHLGDINLAKRMIKEASENGATHVKTQVFNETYLKPGPWDTDGRREIYKKAQPTYDQLMEMKKHCEIHEVKFMASPMSLRDAKMYLTVTNELIKIPGFESRNKELLQFAFDNFQTVIISTGTSSVKEIEDTLSSLDRFNELYYSKLVLLHCVSSYPCDPKTANLQRIRSLQFLQSINYGNPPEQVGFSDHIMGVESVKVALEFDIDWVEKHFTVDRNLPGRDNKFAILPHELKDLSDYIKLREDMLVDHGDDYQECEKLVRDIQTGRFDKK